MATNLRSFRTVRSVELIQTGQTQGLISVQLEQPTASKISIGLEGNRRSVRVDEKAIASKSKYPYLGASLSFSPDDLMMIKGGPDLRRHWFDDVIRSINPGYEVFLSKYEKVLKQRNSLLKSLKERKAFFEELPLWTESLIEAAIPIYLERQKVTKLFLETMQPLYQQLFNTTEIISLHYAHRFPEEFTEDSQLVERLLIDKLNSLAEAELAVGYSLAGPHKDDFEFRINSMDARTFGSQGQTRGLVIAAKVAQLELSRKFRTFSPVLLLDDIISELDDTRVQALVKYLATYPGQLFVTTAEVNKVRSLYELFGDFKVIDLGQSTPSIHELQTYV